MLTEIDRKLDYIYTRVQAQEAAESESSNQRIGNLQNLTTYLIDKGYDHTTISEKSNFHQSLASFLDQSGFLTDKQLAQFTKLESTTTSSHSAVPSTYYENDEVPI